MKLSRILVSLLLVPFLSGCDEVDTPDGNIPADAVSTAQKYEGTYRGQFDGQNGTITLHLNDRQVIANFQSVTGSTGLIRGCSSTVGQLQSFKATEDHGNYKLENLTFQFRGNACGVDGRQVILQFEHNGSAISFIAKILEEHPQMPVENCVDLPTGGQQCTILKPGSPARWIKGRFDRI